jgi:hypothetical protein
MATINLGAIKFNWKGAYNSGTAYAVDDVVSSGGNSYVCIQASTGNAVGNATAYWNIMSSAGTNGTDGTDVGTTITTQGDLLYRDGSGLQRLGAGTSGQVLQTGGTGANPSWGSVSSDYVKVAQSSPTSATSVSFDNVFTTGTYKSYEIVGSNLRLDTARWLQFKFRSSSADVTTSYYWVVDAVAGQSGTQSSSLYSGWDGTYIPVTYYSTATGGEINFKIIVGNPASGTGFKHIGVNSYFHNDSSQQMFNNISGMRNVGSDTYDGFKIAPNNSANFTAGEITVYGLK